VVNSAPRVEALDGLAINSAPRGEDLVRIEASAAAELPGDELVANVEALDAGKVPGLVEASAAAELPTNRPGRRADRQRRGAARPPAPLKPSAARIRAELPTNDQAGAAGKLVANVEALDGLVVDCAPRVEALDAAQAPGLVEMIAAAAPPASWSPTSRPSMGWWSTARRGVRS